MNDFIVVCDTREQDGYTFKNRDVLCIHNKLDAGDYSVKGWEKQIAIERKNPTDFLGSITSGRDRFKAELNILKNYERAFIIVECPLSDLLQPIEIKKGFKKAKGCVRPMCKTVTGVHPNSVMGSIISIGVRYRIQFYFAQNRQDAEDFCLRTLMKYFALKRDGEL